MDGTKKLCRMLDEMGVEYETDVLPNGKCGVSWIDGNDIEWEVVPLGENFEIHALQLVTPEQAIAATVGRCDTMGLWPEWEQVLFANVSDEVAQDNLNDCVHELLDKAATMGAGTCHIEVHDNLAETEGMGDVWLECDECHWQMPLEPTTPRFKYCPNCGAKVVSE